MEDPASQPIPVAAQYAVTFLKPEMLHIYRQIRSLHRFRPVVFCQKRENSEDFPFDEVRVLPKPRTHQLRRLWQKQLLRRPITIYQSEARATESALQEARAKVLHVYFGHIGVHLLPLLERLTIPSVVSFHGADVQADRENGAHQRAMRRMLELATLVLVRSESLGRRLVPLGCPPDKLRVHRTGIPLETIPFHVHSAPADGVWRLLQACRLIAKKGLFSTLEAFAEFNRVHPASTLTLAGDGPLSEPLRARCTELGIENRVFFLGFVKQRDLHALYRESHIFLHPSELTQEGDQEGVPNSLLEAMACGLPSAATLHGGIPEAVEDGVSGLLTPERDPAALARSLLRYASDPALYTAVSSAGAERIRSLFDLQRQGRLLEQYYEEAIARWEAARR